MARNEEKAQAMLNRFVAAKSAANKEDKSKRPYLASECDNVKDCELYRNQIIREISKKVSLIQNEGLEEAKVRDMNDAINKLMREKGHWERQIKALGGPDYFRIAPQVLNADDAEEVVPGRGYPPYPFFNRQAGKNQFKANIKFQHGNPFSFRVRFPPLYEHPRQSCRSLLRSSEPECQGGRNGRGTLRSWDTYPGCIQPVFPGGRDRYRDILLW